MSRSTPRSKVDVLERATKLLFARPTRDITELSPARLSKCTEKQVRAAARLLELADELGRRMLPMFNSPTGMPYGELKPSDIVAVRMDRDAAALMGVEVTRIYAVTFAAGLAVDDDLRLRLVVLQVDLRREDDRAVG